MRVSSRQGSQDHRMSDDSFDIDVISQVISRRSRQDLPAVRAPDRPPEDLTIPVVVELRSDTTDELDTSVLVVDTTTNLEQLAYRCAEGRYLRCRMGVLGVGYAVEQLFGELRHRLEHSQDPLQPALRLFVRYEVALFGGEPRPGGVSRDDAEHLADRLALYEPSVLVVVNAGQVRNKFSTKNAQQLALLTQCINHGALRAHQRPYALVFVTDEPIPDPVFTAYQRICQALGTPPALMQFLPRDVEDIIQYARFEFDQYATHHLDVRTR
ncbi:MAG: hypothetical protein IT371_22620 [Deltaproteobacteria bacterium]|nr:hypothetical protein [Deltaproteobacteria bacterium]